MRESGLTHCHATNKFDLIESRKRLLKKGYVFESNFTDPDDGTMDKRCNEEYQKQATSPKKANECIWDGESSLRISCTRYTRHGPAPPWREKHDARRTACTLQYEGWKVQKQALQEGLECFEYMEKPHVKFPEDNESRKLYWKASAQALKLIARGGNIEAFIQWSKGYEKPAGCNKVWRSLFPANCTRKDRETFRWLHITAILRKIFLKRNTHFKVEFDRSVELFAKQKRCGKKVARKRLLERMHRDDFTAFMQRLGFAFEGSEINLLLSCFPGSLTSLKGRLQKLLLDAAAKGVDAKSAFSHFETASGEITRTSFKQGLTQLHFEHSQEEFDMLIEILDTDNDGTISFSEFLALCEEDGGTKGKCRMNVTALGMRLATIVAAAQRKGLTLNQIFQHWDENNVGVVSCRMFTRGLQELGLSATKKELKALIQILDVDDDGTVSAEEFERFVQAYAATKGTNADVLRLRKKLKSLLIRAQNAGVDVREAFSHWDRSNQGSFERHAFMQGLVSLGFSITAREGAILMSDMDANGDGIIEVGEFISWCNSAEDESQEVSVEVEAAAHHREMPLDTKKVQESLRKALLRAIDGGLHPRQVFEEIDEDGSGYITRAELQRGLRKMNISLRAKDIQYIVDYLDESGTEGTFGYSELLAFCGIIEDPPKGPDVGQGPKADPDVDVNAEYTSSVDADELARKLYRLIRRAEFEGVNLREAFGHFDKDRDGSITRAEFQKGLFNLGFQLKLEEIMGLLDVLDKNHDNTIDYDEFYAWATGNAGSSCPKFLTAIKQFARTFVVKDRDIPVTKMTGYIKMADFLAVTGNRKRNSIARSGWWTDVLSKDGTAEASLNERLSKALHLAGAPLRCARSLLT